MGIEKNFSKKMLESELQIRQQFSRERDEVQLSELDEIDFWTKYSKSVSTMNICAFLLLLIFSFRLFGKPLIKHLIYKEPIQFVSFSIVMIAIVGALFLFVGVYFVIIWTKKPIHVRKGTVYCGNKSWNYLEISKIVVNKMNIANVYSNGKKIFWISAEFDNFESFLSWAEKCRIPVERKVDIVTEKMGPGSNGDFHVPTRYAMLLIVITFIVFFVLIPIGVLLN